MTARDDHAAPAAQTPAGLRERIAEVLAAQPGVTYGQWESGDLHRAADAVLAAFPGPTDETRAEVLAVVENALTGADDFLLLSKIGSPHMQTVSNERAAAVAVVDALRRANLLPGPR